MARRNVWYRDGFFWMTVIGVLLVASIPFALEYLRAEQDREMASQNIENGKQVVLIVRTGSDANQNICRMSEFGYSLSHTTINHGHIIQVFSPNHLN